MTDPIRIELPTFFGMKTVNAFLLKGSAITLIDCGEDSEDVYQALVQALKDEGLSIPDLDKIVITHAHVDHMGMAGRLAKESGAEVWVNEHCRGWATDVEANWIARGKIMQNTMVKYFSKEVFQTIQFGFEGMGKKIKSLWRNIPPELIQIYDTHGVIELGDTPWEVIYAPGHSNTQSCYYDPNSGSLISADMLLKITPTPVMEGVPNDRTVREKGILKMLESYRCFDKMEINKVYPGHYETFSDHRKIIHRQISRIQSRKEQCHQHILDKPAEIMEVYKGLYGEDFSFPAFNMLIGYLDLLESEGRLELIPKDDYYRLLGV